MLSYRSTIACALLCAAGAFAQSGVVKSNGLPIPGATVTATQSGKKVSTTTDETGRYEFEGLAPGTYTVEVQIFGFRAEHREAQFPGQADFTLQVFQRPNPAELRARAQAGGAQPNQLENQIDTAVAAAASAPPAESSDSANEAFLVNGSISRGLQNGQEDATLPQRPDFGPGGGRFGDNGPGGPGGAGAGGPGGAPGGGPGGGGGFAGGGGFGGRGGGGFGGGGGGFGGRGGGPGGGRGGPNAARRRNPNGQFIGNRAGRGRDTSLHGQLFYTGRNSLFDAAPFSFSEGTVPKPDYTQNRFGVTIGGPLQIPKLFKAENTFFFLNYFGTRANNSFYNVGTVPTALERTGDFSQSTILGNPVSIYDPLKNTPFSGNVIPMNRLDPTALGLLQFMPLPNQPGSVQNYVFTTSVPQNTDNLNIRMNQNITKKDRLAGTFNMQDRSGQNAQLFGFLDGTDGRGFNTSLSWTHNFGTRSISSLSYTFNRNRTTAVPFFAFGQDVAAELGINGVSNNPANFGPPNVTFTNFASLNDGTPSVNVVQYSSINETFSFVKGQHNLSAGVSYRRSDLNTQTDQNGRGTFSFSGLETSAFANGLPVSGTGYDFADYLLGLPQSSSVRFGDTSTYFRGNVWSGFIQDDWRVRSNLSFNLGLRYEYYSPLSEKYGHIANLDVSPDFTAAAVVVPGEAGPYSGNLPGSLVRPDKHDWAPRGAVAWKPLPKHSLLVRAGYGIYYNPTVYNQFTSRLASQPPFANTASLVASVDAPLTIENGLVITNGKAILNTWAVDPNYQVGYSQSWNFSLQQELPRAIILDATYLGVKGTHLDIETIPNRAFQGSQRQIGDATGFTFESSNGNSIYHAAQLRVIRRFRRGISINSTYTFSKSIDNSSTFGGVGNTVAQNPFDISAERGLSSFDQRHTLNLSYIFTAPRSEHKLLSDWTLSGGITATSGTPFTARVLGNQSNIGGSGSVGSGRAEATGLSIDDPAGFFNPLAFTVPAPGTLGNAARNTIPGLGQWTWNTAFGRSFQFGDTRRRLELRLEANNVLNHVNFTSIGTVVNASNYGLPLAASAMRSVDATIRFRF